MSTGEVNGTTVNDELTRDFPELAHLTRDEILALLSDDAHYDAVLHTLPQADALLRAHASKIDANIQLAEQNQRLRPALEQLRQETARAFDEANELKERWTYIDQAQQDAFKVIRCTE